MSRLHDVDLLVMRLKKVLEALRRIPRRFASINSPDDFLQSEAGRDCLDAICMTLIAVGEAIKQIDYKTSGRLLSLYPNVDWRGVVGVRNVIAHGYFDVDVEQVFAICQTDIPVLIETIEIMIDDLGENAVASR